MSTVCLVGCHCSFQRRKRRKMRKTMSSEMVQQVQTCHSWARSSCCSDCRSAGRSPQDAQNCPPLCQRCCTALLLTASSTKTVTLQALFAGQPSAWLSLNPLMSACCLLNARMPMPSSPMALSMTQSSCATILGLASKSNMMLQQCLALLV